jgi:hypothetical protein
MGAYYYKGEAEDKPGTVFAGGSESAHWQIDCKQHVAIAVGHALFVFVLE